MRLQRTEGVEESESLRRIILQKSSSIMDSLVDKNGKGGGRSWIVLQSLDADLRRQKPCKSSLSAPYTQLNHYPRPPQGCVDSKP